MIAILDYGVGNLFSLRSSLAQIGADAVVTDNPAEIANASGMILPGVGAFADAAAKLKNHGLDEVIREQVKKGKPLLGICLGMQMLYERSHEYGVHEGLGLVSGEVVSLAQALGEQGLKVPQIGWNDIELKGQSPLFKYSKSGEFVYYVHSFYAPVSDTTTAYSRYGTVEVTGGVQNGCVFGTQFHPEKSGEVGLRMLKAFCEIK